MKEWGVELVQDEIINPKGEEKSLSVYNKKKFLKNLIDKCNLYVNDSIYSMDSFYPTIINVDENKYKSIEECGIMVGINDNGGICAWIKSKDFRYLSWKSIYYNK